MAKASWCPRFILLSCRGDHSIGTYDSSQVRKCWKPSLQNILALPMGWKAESISENLKAHLPVCSSPPLLAICCVIDCSFHHFWRWLPPTRVLGGYDASLWAWTSIVTIEFLVGIQWLWRVCVPGSNGGSKGNSFGLSICGLLIWAVAQRHLTMLAYNRNYIKMKEQHTVMMAF